jgi:GT2 family glycosyltransferase
MVGPLLLFEDGRIQSAGHSNTHSLHNFCAGLSSNIFGHFRMLKLAREVSGVTGACALIKRDAYFEVGGMSEIFPLAFNDCDIAFKFLERGYRIIWTPNARLFHFESATRPPTVKPSEVQLIWSRWGRKINNDQYCKVH